MNCDDFDTLWLDLMDGSLADDLDPARRKEALGHLDSCTHCKEKWESLQHFRNEFQLPTLSVPTHLEHRILVAADEAEVKRRPLWLQRMDEWISSAGRYAMRPQLAMGLVLTFMVGVSLLLLRPKPGPDAVRVTELGIPAAEKEASDNAPTTNSPHANNADPKARPGAAAHNGNENGKKPALEELSTGDSNTDPAFERAMTSYKARNFKEAAKDFALVGKGTGTQAAQAALFEARSLRYSSGGCSTALPKFEKVASRFPDTSIAADAMWGAAICSKELTRYSHARKLLQTLRENKTYSKRAQEELKKLRESEDKNTRANRAKKSDDPSKKVIIMDGPR
jgi:TolA-binding protein